jgi:hypothetical protein
MTTPQETAHKREQDMASVVLSRIESEGVQVTPRAHFLLREGVVWAVGVLSVILGALGVAAIIFTARYAEWEYYEATHDTLLTFGVEVMPYTWILALLVFAVLAYESVRHTKRGYRYSVLTLISVSVGTSVLFGGLLYVVGAGPFIDAHLGARIPLHRSLAETQLRMWDKPERGVIAGVVTEVSEARDAFTLRSPSQVLHTIRMDDLDEDTRSVVVVGNAMRVLAPFRDRLAEVPPDTATHATSFTAASDATSMTMMATEAGMPAQDMAPPPGEASRMMKSALVEIQDSEVREARRELFREACAVLPGRSVDAKDGRARERFKECVSKLRANRMEVK